MDKEIVKSMREAIKQGNLDLVKKLNVNNEGLLNVDTIFGSWLHVASAHGQINIVEYLIKCGLDVNQNGDISGGHQYEVLLKTDILILFNYYIKMEPNLM